MRLLIQRYVAAQFILPLLVSSVFFITFLLTFELFKLTELLVTRDVSLFFLIKLLGNIALTFVPLSLPISIFFSTLYLMGKLSSDSEYIAMRASGMTKGRILTPILLVAFLLSISIYQMNQNLIPQSNKVFRQKINYLASSGLLAGIKEGQFFTQIPNITLFASSASKFGRNLKDVFLHIKENPQSTKIIFAQEGELLFERNPDSLSEKLTLSLSEGNIVGKINETNIEKILFQKYVLPLSQRQFDSSFDIKETMLTSKELAEVLDMPFEMAQKKYNFNEKEFFNAKYEYWGRKNGSFICFVFCFLGFCLGISGNRGKNKNSAFIGFICLVFYYAVFFGMVAIAKKGTLPIPIAVFMPLFIMTLISVYFYKKLDWQG